MKLNNLEKRVSRCFIALFFTVAVLYGGAKNTNSLQSVGHRPLGRNEVEKLGGGGQWSFNSKLHYSASTFNLDYQFNFVSNWTARGAYCDWTRVEFPDGFAFPIGTNEIAAVSLMAWGELRQQMEVESGGGLRMGDAFAALPERVSLEPGVSSVTHGLTASNSYLFVWQDCCVNRDATNRVNASIELFRSGASAITVQSPGSLPSTIYQLPPLPEGFAGEGQDTNWVASVFTNASDLAAIAEKGYDDWLEEDYVGINEQNGHYQAAVTVAALPADGSPCYLVCGPYKVVVKEPGTYRFPLEVFETYEVRTYPTAVPISIVTDDGYRAAGAPAAGSGTSGQTTETESFDTDRANVKSVRKPGRLIITPDSIYFEPSTERVEVKYWCNMTNIMSRYCESLFDTSDIQLIGSDRAVISNVRDNDRVKFFMQGIKDAICEGTLHVYFRSGENGSTTNGCVCVAGHNTSCQCLGCRLGGTCLCGYDPSSQTNGVPPNATQP